MFDRMRITRFQAKYGRTSSTITVLCIIAFVVCFVCAYTFSSQLPIPFDRTHGDSYPPYRKHGEDVGTKSPSRYDQRMYSLNAPMFTDGDGDSGKPKKEFIDGANTNKSCYLTSEYTPNNRNKTTFPVPRPLHELEILGCKKRLPGVLTVGVKKCGTTALRFFLNSHPQVVFTDKREVHYFDGNYDQNIEWYLEKMPYTRQDQISTEKSPLYFVSDEVPRRIFQDIAHDVKIIMVMCDPVNRAVSDFVQVSKALKKTTINMERRARLSLEYGLKRTFEDSVIHPNGTVDVHTALIDVGLYIKHIRRWLEYFPLRQILVLDGGVFRKEPYKELKKIEDFLNVSTYFTTDHFYFDAKKGFFCLRLPMRKCLPNSRGHRYHPKVNKKVLLKLREFFRPYNQQLQSLLNMKFQW